MKHKHHIVPRYLGGSDEPSNIVELTIEEHAQAHKKLWEELGNYQDFLAWQGLAGLMTKEEIVKIQLSEAGKKGGKAGKGVSGNRANGGHVNWEKNQESVRKRLNENGKKYGHLGGAKRKWKWITNSDESTKILHDEPIPDGWNPGRHSRKKLKS